MFTKAEAVATTQYWSNVKANYGQAFLDHFQKNVLHKIRQASEQGDSTINLVEQNAASMHFANVESELQNLGFTVAHVTHASPTNHYLQVSW